MKHVEISYIENTESYIENNKDSIPKQVYEFIKQVCQDERKYHELVQSWSTETYSEKMKRMKKKWAANDI